jgi:hypothetical protein
MSHTELLIELERQLKGHDWYYQRSDDSRYYRKGQDQRDSIVALGRKLAQLGYKAEFDSLFNAYAKG